MDAKAEMEAFLAHRVSPFVRERGFHRRGQRYAAARGDNSIFVHFQRRAGFFTCDLGIVSALLLAALGPFPPEHWRQRLGAMALEYDRWWDLEDGQEVVAAEFLPALGRGLDRVEPLATDEGLRDELLREVMLDPRPPPPAVTELVLPLIRALGPPAWVAPWVAPSDV